MDPDQFREQSETWFSFLKGFVDGFIVPIGKTIADFGQFLFNHPAWTIALIIGSIALGLLIKYAWKVGLVVLGVVLLLGVGWAAMTKGGWGEAFGNLLPAGFFHDGDKYTASRVAERLLSSLEENEAGRISVERNTLVLRLDANALEVSKGESIADTFGVDTLVVRFVLPKNPNNEKASLEVGTAFNPLAFRILSARWEDNLPMARIPFISIAHAQQSGSNIYPSVWWQDLGFVELQNAECKLGEVAKDRYIFCKLPPGLEVVMVVGEIFDIIFGRKGDPQEEQPSKEDVAFVGKATYLECVFPQEWVDKIIEAKKRDNLCARDPDRMECAHWDGGAYEKLLQEARASVPKNSFRCSTRVEGITHVGIKGKVLNYAMSRVRDEILGRMVPTSSSLLPADPLGMVVGLLFDMTVCQMSKAAWGETLPRPYVQFQLNQCIADAAEAQTPSLVTFLRLLEDWQKGEEDQ